MTLLNLIFITFLIFLPHLTRAGIGQSVSNVQSSDEGRGRASLKPYFKVTIPENPTFELDVINSQPEPDQPPAERNTQMDAIYSQPTNDAQESIQNDRIMVTNSRGRLAASCLSSSAVLAAFLGTVLTAPPAYASSAVCHACMGAIGSAGTSTLYTTGLATCDEGHQIPLKDLCCACLPGCLIGSAVSAIAAQFVPVGGIPGFRPHEVAPFFGLYTNICVNCTHFLCLCCRERRNQTSH